MTTQPTYSEWQTHNRKLNIAMRFLMMILIYMGCITFINGLDVILSISFIKAINFYALILPFGMLWIYKHKFSIPPIRTPFIAKEDTLDLYFPSLAIVFSTISVANMFLMLLIIGVTANPNIMTLADFYANFTRTWTLDIVSTLYMGEMFLLNWFIPADFYRLQNQRWESMKWLA